MNKTLDQIRKALGHCTMEWTPRLWLDTGIPDLNLVIGHRVRGIPYGRIIEMSGLESHGKTALVMALSALAQQDKALVIWGDLENSFETDWALQRGMAKCPSCQGSGREKGGKSCKVCGSTKQVCSLCDGVGCPDCQQSGQERGSGLNPDRLILIQPYVGCFNEVVADKFGRKTTKISKPRLSTGTELCSEIEKSLVVSHKDHDRLVVVVDSLASILTEGEAAAGIEGANLRTAMDLPTFLGRLLRRWVGLAQAYNALIILTNQLRQNPMQRFGSPWYTPGGNAPHFYSHIRVRVTRVKGGKIITNGKVSGIQGVMKAVKNKTGGLEGSEVGYRLMFNGPVEFLPVKEVRRKEEEED